MALTATYDALLSRIRLAMTGVGGTAVTAKFERSVGGLRWETVRGGVSAPISTVQVDDYEFPAGVLLTYRVTTYTAAGALVDTFTTTITQDLDAIWLKVPARPFMNRAVIVSSVGELQRAARQGLHQVIGRSNPVAVSDIRSSVTFELKVRTETLEEEEDLDYLLASGEPIFIHLPNGEHRMRGGYYAVGDATWTPAGSKSRPARVFTLPLTGVAAPGPDMVGSVGTWQTVMDTYTTWADLMAAKATWADVLQLVGDPSEVLVP